MMKKLPKAQSIVEYTIILALIMFGILVGGPYAKRAINAHLKGWEDGVKDSMKDPLTSASSADLANIPGPCLKDGKCHEPYEDEISCCEDCGWDGDGVCCRDEFGVFVKGDYPGSPDCEIPLCGNGICDPGEDEASCCQDCECPGPISLDNPAYKRCCEGINPGEGKQHDKRCCTDKHGKPAGCDGLVGATDCKKPGCNFDNTCDANENEITCCNDCHVCGDGVCHSCETSESCPECCERDCLGKCSTPGCVIHCPGLCPCPEDTITRANAARYLSYPDLSYVGFRGTDKKCEKNECNKWCCEGSCDEGTQPGHVRTMHWPRHMLGCYEIADDDGCGHNTPNCGFSGVDPNGWHHNWIIYKWDKIGYPVHKSKLKEILITVDTQDKTCNNREDGPGWDDDDGWDQGSDLKFPLNETPRLPGNKRWMFNYCGSATGGGGGHVEFEALFDADDILDALVVRAGDHHDSGYFDVTSIFIDCK